MAGPLHSRIVSNSKIAQETEFLSSNWNYSADPNYNHQREPAMDCDLNAVCSDWPKFEVDENGDYPAFEDWVLDECNYCNVNGKVQLCGNTTDAG